MMKKRRSDAMLVWLNKAMPGKVRKLLLLRMPDSDYWTSNLFYNDKH